MESGGFLLKSPRNGVIGFTIFLEKSCDKLMSTFGFGSHQLRASKSLKSGFLRTQQSSPEEKRGLRIDWLGQRCRKAVCFLSTNSTDNKCEKLFGAYAGVITKGSPLGDTLSLTCEASVGESGSNN